VYGVTSGERWRFGEIFPADSAALCADGADGVAMVRVIGKARFFWPRAG
jgi:hypothetical protein